MQGLDGAECRTMLERTIGAEHAAVAGPAFRESATVAVRLNPFKIAVQGSCASVSEARDFAQAHFGPDVAEIPWNPYGFLLPERPVFTLDPLLHAGCYYVQDASAQFPGLLFRQLLPRFAGLDRPVRVLDLCAAPGGKTTDLAASLRMLFGDRFLLVSNDVMRGRAAVLSDNVAVWGDSAVTVTCADPKAFAALEGCFDIVLTDLPCSGEGMFRKDPVAAAEWSEAVVALCAARQRRILADVWPALREGGILVYATCTFEPAENDENVAWTAARLGAELLPPPAFPDSPDRILPTRTGSLLVPGFVRGEGQFAAALVKTAASGVCRHPEDALARLRPLRAGMPQEVRKGADRIPTADMALCFRSERGRWPEAALDRETALKFLHRDNLVLPDAPRGFVLVTYEGHPLGFVKNLGNRCNNLHPLSRRIRMEID